jgi:hypothetical protein
MDDSLLTAAPVFPSSPSTILTPDSVDETAAEVLPVPPESVPPAADDPFVAAHGPHGAEARKALTDALAARTYDESWLPESVRARKKDMDFDLSVGAVVLTLDSGTKITDRGDSLEISGKRLSDSDIAAFGDALAAKGWDRVSLAGDDDYLKRISLDLALREPPIAAAGLSDDVRMWLDRELVQRQPKPEAIPDAPAARLCSG